MIQPTQAVAALALGAMAPLAVVTLYQVGRIAHLPDPPLPGFDADCVHGSADAYVLGVPDGILGLGSYATTLALALACPPGPVAARPWLSLALAAKVGFDLSQALRLTVREIHHLHALSLWSLLTSGATVAMTPLVVPEAQAAWRRLRA